MKTLPIDVKTSFTQTQSPNDTTDADNGNVIAADTDTIEKDFIEEVVGEADNVQFAFL